MEPPEIECRTGSKRKRQISISQSPKLEVNDLDTDTENDPPSPARAKRPKTRTGTPEVAHKTTPETVNMETTADNIEAPVISRIGKGRKAAGTKSDRPTSTQPPFDCHRNEAKVTLYLGFKDIVQCRLYKLSAPVLKAHRRIRTNGLSPKYYKGAIETLRALGVQHLRDEFNKAPDNFPKSHRLALILADLVEDTKTTEGQSSDLRKAIYATEREAYFREVTEPGKRRTVKTPDVPEIDPFRVRSPHWGPLQKYGETDLERYGRAFNVVFSLDQTLMPSKFATAYGKDPDKYFASNLANLSNTPTFMVQKALAEPKLLEKQKLSRCEFHFRPKSDQEVFDGIHEKVAKDLIPEWVDSTEPVRFNRSPYRYTSCQWRDVMRIHLRLEDIKCNFTYIDIRSFVSDRAHKHAGPKKHRIWSEDGEGVTIEWEDFKSWLMGRLGLFEIIFELTAISDTGDDFPYESFDPPVQFSDDPAPDKRKYVIPTQDEHTSEHSEEQKEEMEGLSGPDRAVPGKNPFRINIPGKQFNPRS